MDEEKKTNAWDSLLEDLGAEPDSKAFERHQPPAQEIQPTAEWSEAESATPEPKASAGDWNSLAESLGLEVDESTLDSPPVNSGSDEPPTSRQSRSEKTYDKTYEEPGAAFQQDAPTEEHLADDVSFEEDSTVAFPSKAAQGESRSQDEAGSSEDLPPLPTPMDQALSETAWDDTEASSGEESGDETSGDGENATTADADHTEGQGITGEAARSAFDALFSEGATGWGSAFLPTPKREETARGSKQAGGDELKEVFSESTNAPEAKAGGEEDGEPPKRKRSRRRRRGGKGRKAAGERKLENRPDDGQTSETQSELSETHSEQAKQQRTRTRSQPTESDKDDDDDLLLDGEAGDGERSAGSGRGRQRHRNIPAWSEAIGMIVDANLEQRAKSPSKPQSSRSRGGRGRGGRNRGGKKPERK